MTPRSQVPWHSKLNLPALIRHASQLRNVPCSCDLSQRRLSGSLNWAIFLSFEDGVEWVFRSPKFGEDDLSLEVVGELLESEVATMKYIKLHSCIPIPDIFDYSSVKSNAIGVPFILMSKAAGTQLQDFKWETHSLEKGNSPQRLHLSETQKEKIMRQLGEITSQLSNLQFNKIGSLFEEAGEFRVGKCLSPAFIFHDRDSLTSDKILRGPFKHDDDYYNALLSVFLLHVQELKLQHNVFFAPVPVLEDFKTSQSRISASSRWQDYVMVGAKIDGGKNRLDYYTAGYFLQRMIPFIGGESVAASASLGEDFSLCHPNLSTSNIFVDNDLNITCIIDWAFVSTGPLSMSRMTPGLPHPRDDTDLILDSAFKSGFIDHHFSGKDLKSAPELWEYTRKAWLFTRLVVLNGLQDYCYFKELYMSVYKPQEEINISGLFKIAQKENDLVEVSQALADDEESASEILNDENDYFAKIGQTEKPVKGQHELKLIGIERRAIARKITMVSDLSQDFVADKRLWRWIEEMMLPAIHRHPGMDSEEDSSIVDNPLIKQENRIWEVEPPKSFSAPISPPLAATRPNTTHDISRLGSQHFKSKETCRHVDMTINSRDLKIPATAAIEAGRTQIHDHIAYFSSKVASYSIPTPHSPRITLPEFISLYKRNQNSGGHHFVVHEHNHPIAGTHYDLRLQFSQTSSISFAIMYGLPGDPNSKRLNRNAIETRVHNVWSHLIETASHSTGSLLIWDIGEYEILPRRSKHAPKVDPDSTSEGDSTDISDLRIESAKLSDAFHNRKIRLRLHGTRLPKNYTLSIRLTKKENRTEQPRKPVRKRRRLNSVQMSKSKTKETQTSSTDESEEDDQTGDDVVPSQPQAATADLTALERELQEQEDEEVRRTNAYPGATNSIGSIYQRKWFLSIDRPASGFYKSLENPIRWNRQVTDDGKLEGFEPFYVMGRNIETSVVTGRTAEQVLVDEGVEGYKERKGWRAVIE